MVTKKSIQDFSHNLLVTIAFIGIVASASCSKPQCPIDCSGHDCYCAKITDTSDVLETSREKFLNKTYHPVYTISMN